LGGFELCSVLDVHIHEITTTQTKNTIGVPISFPFSRLSSQWNFARKGEDRALFAWSVCLEINTCGHLELTPFLAEAFVAACTLLTEFIPHAPRIKTQVKA